MNTGIVATPPRAGGRNRYVFSRGPSGGNVAGRHQRPAAVTNRPCVWAAGALLAIVGCSGSDNQPMGPGKSPSELAANAMVQGGIDNPSLYVANEDMMPCVV